MPPRSFCSSRAPSLIGGSLWSQREGGGCRKERIPLNSGDPAEPPRMLVPLSLHSPCDEVLSGLSVLLRRLRRHSLFAKAVAVLTLPTRELVTCRGSSSRSTMTHFGVRTPPWWTGAPAALPRGVDATTACRMQLRVRPPTTRHRGPLSFVVAARDL